MEKTIQQPLSTTTTQITATPRLHFKAPSAHQFFLIPDSLKSSLLAVLISKRRIRLHTHPIRQSREPPAPNQISNTQTQDRTTDYVKDIVAIVLKTAQGYEQGAEEGGEGYEGAVEACSGVEDGELAYCFWVSW